METINKEPEASIRAYMIAQSETIAVAESVTSGLLQWHLSSIPDASKFFQGGITAANGDEIVAEGKIISPGGDPMHVQFFYAREILEILGDILKKRGEY